MHWIRIFFTSKVATEFLNFATVCQPLSYENTFDKSKWSYNFKNKPLVHNSDELILLTESFACKNLKVSKVGIVQNNCKCKTTGYII